MTKRSRPIHSTALAPADLAHVRGGGIDIPGESTQQSLDNTRLASCRGGLYFPESMLTPDLGTT